MAKITKSDNAPKDAVHFSFGQVEFDLATPKASFETNDEAVIAGARTNPWLSVKEDAPAPDDTSVAVDSLDPHVNPQVDHMSALATPEAVEAAARNEEAIREAVGLSALVSSSGSGGTRADNPTIAETLQATFDNVNTDAKPVLADKTAEAPAPEPTEPGGGVAPDAGLQAAPADRKGS